MRTEEIRSLNENLTNDKISMPYPHLFIDDPSDAVALVLPALPVGPLSVLCEHGGLVKRIRSIEVSALHINKLRKVCTIKYYQNADTCKNVVTPEDVMEVMELWMQSSL